MKIFKRLLRITRTALLAILAVYAVAALILVNLFEPVVTKYSEGQVVVIDGATHNSICYNRQAMAAAGNGLAKNGLAETTLTVR